jgi:hypothetical protein
VIVMNRIIQILILGILSLVSSVSAADLTSASSSVREFTQTAYPIELFYAIFLTGLICLILDIIFIASRQGVPASAMILTSIIGFMIYLAAAYMAPFAAKITTVVTDTEVRSVANYILSPEITYLCLGLATICFLFVVLGVLRYFQLLAENEKEISNPDRQFEMYLQGKNV